MAIKNSVELKEPILAALLAWLVPGLGHYYQGRLFKAVLYSVSILGLFGTGWLMTGGQVVSFMWHSKWQTKGYIMQLGAGLPALPAIVQNMRIPKKDNQNDPFLTREFNRLRSPLAGEFVGFLESTDILAGERIPVRGQISISPSPQKDPSAVEGEFDGVVSKLVQLNDLEVPEGKKVTIQLKKLRGTEPEIYPSPHRSVVVDFRGEIELDQIEEFQGKLTGSIKGARALLDRVWAPMDMEGYMRLHEKGKALEIGWLYTWVAGLLNLLAIWDAYEGPAYKQSEDPKPA